MCDRLSANNVYPYFVYIKLKSQLLLHIKLKLIKDKDNMKHHDSFEYHWINEFYIQSAFQNCDRLPSKLGISLIW